MAIKLTETSGGTPQARPQPRQETRPNPFQAQRDMVEKNLVGIGKIIAVHSGKGGVGKSFFAVNLAAALAKQGFGVGLVDADVDCPSCHKMLGNAERVFADESGRLRPLEGHRVKFLSVGNMVAGDGTAQIMRGPIMFKLISEMLYKADWGKLEYMIVDLPPGTGDNPLTVMQVAPLYGLIIVTQPQEVALADARKSIDMAKRMGVPVIGVVENMSGEVFGTGGAEKMCEKLQQNFLGTIPLKREAREFSDKGVPAALADGEIGEIFNSIIAGAGI